MLSEMGGSGYGSGTVWTGFGDGSVAFEMGSAMVDCSLFSAIWWLWRGVFSFSLLSASFCSVSWRLSRSSCLRIRRS